MYKTVTEPREKKDRVRGTIFFFQCVYRCIDWFFFCAYIHVSQGFALPGLFWLLECADSVKTHPITINTI